MWKCFCGNEYATGDEFEYHLRKEHTKTDMIAYFKKQEFNRQNRNY
jgi:hypothetical protein